MNINDMPDGLGRDPWLYNDSLYFEEDNPRFQKEETIDERLFEVRKKAIAKLTNPEIA